MKNLPDMESVKDHIICNVIIVGAGAAGIGMAVALQDFGIKDFLVVEKEYIGALFRRWPKETKLLTPSFQSTQFGLLDLNAVAINTSPALSAGLEHLSGEDYALYLTRVTDSFNLPIRPYTCVESVTFQNGSYVLATNKAIYRCKNLIWATGEFQFPELCPFPGAELCLHASKVESYADLSGNEFLIIGGYESGMDAAINLASAGKEIIVLEKGETASLSVQDPSVSLSYYTRQRIAENESTDNIVIVENCMVHEVIATEGKYEVYTNQGIFESLNQPVLATGYRGGEHQVQDYFHWNADEKVQLNAVDESTRSNNLFLVGPHVSHKEVIFCFIYKFRQRFGIIADTIAKRSGIRNRKMTAFYKQNQMYLEDLRCCTVDCKC